MGLSYDHRKVFDNCLKLRARTLTNRANLEVVMKIKSYITILFFFSLVISQSHFTPIWFGNPLQPFALYIETATVDGQTLTTNDEIGVFDGDICVGAILLDGDMLSTATILSSADDPDTPEVDGYIEGGEVQIRIWDASNSIELVNVDIELISGSSEFEHYGSMTASISAVIITGCMDPEALNYNPEAVLDDGSCIYEVLGCMDPEACNYDPDATVDNGSCLYWDCAGVCGGAAYYDDCGVCDDNPENDNLCVGCTDPRALNYNPDLIIGDGSCIYPGVGDANTDGDVDILDIVLTVDLILHSEDIEYNYFWLDINQDEHVNILDIVMLVDWILHPENAGCTNSYAVNYNPDVEIDDGTCILPFNPEQVYINAGEFVYGEDGEIQILDYNYEIMKYEVTNTQYVNYLETAMELGDVWITNYMVWGHYEGDLSFEAGDFVYFDIGSSRIQWDEVNFSIESGYEEHPLVGITWIGAMKMAECYGLRLPTEMEWEKAARGCCDALDYPWGNDPPVCDLNATNGANFSRCWNETTAVGSFINSINPFDLYDMTGNVWEWTDSYFDGPEIGANRVKRGGCWLCNASYMPTWHREIAWPTNHNNSLGFRLAKSLP